MATPQIMPPAVQPLAFEFQCTLLPADLADPLCKRPHEEVRAYARALGFHMARTSNPHAAAFAGAFVEGIRDAALAAANGKRA